MYLVTGNFVSKKLINNRKSPLQDDYIERYLTEKKLNLTATLNAIDGT